MELWQLDTVGGDHLLTAPRFGACGGSARSFTGVASTPRLSAIELHRFKGFRDFTVSFGDLAVLIGPNNARKSSVVGALAAASHMLRVAMKFRASTPRHERWRVGTASGAGESQGAGCWSTLSIACAEDFAKRTGHTLPSRAQCEREAIVGQ